MEREVWGTIPGLIKLDTVLSTARHCCDIFRRVLCCPHTMTRRMALQLVVRLAYRSEYNEDLIFEDPFFVSMIFELFVIKKSFLLAIE